MPLSDVFLKEVSAGTGISFTLDTTNMLLWAGYVMTAITLPLAIRGGVGVAARIGKVISGFLR